MEQKKATPLGGRVWFCALFFGLIGQIAWMVENMYFATLAQDIFSNSGRGDLSYVVTTLMVIFSAIAATVTTIIAGGFTDRAGKRKPFIAIGYIIWGVTIMVFCLLPMRVSNSRLIGPVAALLVVFDCVMTVAGSTSNDAAFNAWVADNTDSTNRGKLNGILSVLPLIAVVIVFVVLGGLYNGQAENNRRFFLVLGAIPILAGILALFVLQDAPRTERNAISLRDTFYGFQPKVIRENRVLYISLTALCLVGIAQQTFFSYLINFLINTLGLGDGFTIPMAVIIVGAGVVTGVIGFRLDARGRKHFYLPLLGATIAGILSFYFLKYLSGAAATVVLYAGGIIMMGGLLSCTSALTANFQDYIPEGCAGRFQGVRMCFVVLIPMIIGPIVSLMIGIRQMEQAGGVTKPPYEMFLAAAVIALLGLIPMAMVQNAD